VGLDGTHRLVGIVARRQAHADLGARERHELVDRLGDRRGIDSEDGDGRLHPDARRQRPAAGELQALDGADLLAHLRLGEVERVGVA
jgi:hypothetical protein